MPKLGFHMMGVVFLVARMQAYGAANSIEAIFRCAASKLDVLT